VREQIQCDDLCAFSGKCLTSAVISARDVEHNFAGKIGQNLDVLRDEVVDATLREPDSIHGWHGAHYRYLEVS
jgi:hypothetical protein